MTDIFAGEVMNQEKELTGIERELVLHGSVALYSILPQQLFLS